MKQLRTSILTVLNIVPLVGIFYFLVNRQYSLMFLCIAIFLVAFLTALQMTPSKIKRCPSCGCDLSQFQSQSGIIEYTEVEFVHNGKRYVGAVHEVEPPK